MWKFHDWSRFITAIPVVLDDQLILRKYSELKYRDRSQININSDKNITQWFLFNVQTIIFIDYGTKRHAVSKLLRFLVHGLPHFYFDYNICCCMQFLVIGLQNLLSICIGNNSMVSSAIWEKKHALTSEFFGDDQNCTSPKDECNLKSLKTHECICFSKFHEKPYYYLLIIYLKKLCSHIMHRSH